MKNIGSDDDVNGILGKEILILEMMISTLKGMRSWLELQNHLHKEYGNDFFTTRGSNHILMNFPGK